MIPCKVVETLSLPQRIQAALYLAFEERTSAPVKSLIIKPLMPAQSSFAIPHQLHRTEGNGERQEYVGLCRVGGALASRAWHGQDAVSCRLRV